jgi:hypothetical protein
MARYISIWEIPDMGCAEISATFPTVKSMTLHPVWNDLLNVVTSLLPKHAVRPSIRYHLPVFVLAITALPQLAPTPLHAPSQIALASLKLARRLATYPTQITPRVSTLREEIPNDES